MEIIVRGCSFTAGDELVELIPNYLSKAILIPNCINSIINK